MNTPWLIKLFAVLLMLRFSTDNREAGKESAWWAGCCILIPRRQCFWKRQEGQTDQGRFVDGGRYAGGGPDGRWRGLLSLCLL